MATPKRYCWTFDPFNDMWVFLQTSSILMVKTDLLGALQIWAPLSFQQIFHPEFLQNRLHILRPLTPCELPTKTICVGGSSRFPVSTNFSLAGKSPFSNRDYPPGNWRIPPLQRKNIDSKVPCPKIGYVNYQQGTNLQILWISTDFTLIDFLENLKLSPVSLSLNMGTPTIINHKCLEFFLGDHLWIV